MEFLPYAAQCFSKSGWVLRKLSNQELFRILDIPKALDEGLLKYLWNDYQEVGDFHNVLHSLSGKVTWFVARSLFPLKNSSVECNLILDLLFKPIIRGDFNPVSDQGSSIEKSVKSDDASVPISLWNVKLFDKANPYMPSKHDQILENFRNSFAMPWYRRNLLKSFMLYMRRKHGRNCPFKLSFLRRHQKEGMMQSELLKDGNVGCDAVGRAVNADWWN